MGGYIREKRKPLSLRDFAKRLRMSASYLSDIERGNRKISKDMVMRIVCALGGEIHEHYDMILTLTDQLSPERRCLKAVWGSIKLRLADDEEFQFMEEHIYHALYNELDVAFYGHPLRVLPAYDKDKD